MPEKAATPSPRKGLLLRLLRWLSWLLIIVALVGVAVYLAFGPAHMIDRLMPPPPAFPEEVIEEPAVAAKPAAAPPPAAIQHAPADSQELTILMLESIEDIWGEFLARADYSYKKPKVVIFRDRLESPCQLKGTFSGPLYCSGTSQLYLDMGYLDDLQKNAPQVGDLARSYVVAHAAAHHIQKLVGVVGWFRDLNTDLGPSQGSESLRVTQELVADCLVGSWISYARRKYAWLEPEQLDAALKAVRERDAARAGAGLPPMADPLDLPDSAARLRWLNIGIDSGDPRECSKLFTVAE
ncbi:neutral zinc metallopeptidase [Pseudomonas sp. JM0905a]|uniref:Neutral zinc metallopeptidase n=1 Tax=Metapseudomonas resinovorans TaxID=53412 RepID=A0ABT4Y582_METRE|nr:MULTISPECIES: neutral zinc metallopeptidase [Pseudomonas]MBD2837743.1 neutral zinc metallopeptidase [Pseudomonas sp. JM0905a]MDA8484020.1 neutral zinc metallopeptidase [Pseudomonas resinovorans]